MKRLIPRHHLKKYNLAQIEGPFFAEFEVRSALLCPEKLGGLLELIRECGLSSRDCFCEPGKWMILQKVECGDWLLVSEAPFSPLSQDTFGTYSHLTQTRLLTGFTGESHRRRLVSEEVSG